jgi:hypothetical protein
MCVAHIETWLNSYCGVWASKKFRKFLLKGKLKFREFCYFCHINAIRQVKGNNTEPYTCRWQQLNEYSVDTDSGD